MWVVVFLSLRKNNPVPDGKACVWCDLGGTHVFVSLPDALEELSVLCVQHPGTGHLYPALPKHTAPLQEVCHVTLSISVT